MKRNIYFMINRIVIFLSLIFFGKLIYSTYKIISFGIGYNWYWIALSILLILLGHVFKGIRLYLILIEKHLTLKEFMGLYIKTTFITFVFPYKIGEVFRAFFYGKKLNNYVEGTFLILIDRYFDSIPLIVSILGYAAIIKGRISTVAIILTLFILLVNASYILLPSTYSYFNHFLIVNSTSKRGYLLLKYIERVNDWYKQIKTLVYGRATVLTLFSYLAWLVEFSALWALSKGVNIRFGAADFIKYLDNVLINANSNILSIYLVLGALVFICLAVIKFILSFSSKEMKTSEQSSLRV